jgi:hypothetical protein
MSDRDVVNYCVVDTRFYLRDPPPLFESNFESLRRLLDIAAEECPQKWSASRRSRTHSFWQPNAGEPVSATSSPRASCRRGR